MEKAAEIRTIELADASRGMINTAYSLKAKANPVSFEAMIKVYLKWYKDNPDKKAWETATCNSKPVLRAFKRKLLSDINPWMVEQYKNARAKVRARSTVNSELALGSEVFKWAIKNMRERIHFQRFLV